MAKLTASDGVDGDDFGWSVALDGDTIVVGAPDVDEQTGAAYVFQEISPEAARALSPPRARERRIGRGAAPAPASRSSGPSSPGLVPTGLLVSPDSGLTERDPFLPAETHLCFEFLYCDGLELGLDGDEIVGWWRNTDCEGADVRVRGRMTATHAVIGCDPERDPCPLGSEWNFIFDGSLDGTVDMHRFEVTNWNLWLDEVKYTTTPGACPF